MSWLLEGFKVLICPICSLSNYICLLNGMIPVVLLVCSCMLLAIALASSGMFATAFQITPEDCGDIQHDVENGLIRLPDFSGESIRDLNCSWTYTAPVGRKLLVKVDSVHLPPLELRTSQFQLYIDDTFYDIPRNCVKCLREMVGGKVLNVIFTSTVAPFSDYHALNASEVASLNEGIGSFQVRYKAFDPHRCGKPEQVENSYITGKGRKVGQSIFYHCYPPYDLIGDSELQCVVTSETPVPDWSSKAPKCIVQDCTGEPIIKRGVSGAIASPGYPSYISQFTVPCIWEIVAQPNQQIKVSITYLKFPKRVDNSFSDNTSRLSLLDGDYDYIVNLTESSINGPLNYTTLTNKLTVEFIINDDPKKKEEIGVYIDYSTISSSCPKPKSPDNGEVIAYSNDLGSTVAYRCNQRFVLVGELHAECLFNGQWSHPTPTCEPININLPSFLYASNDSDTVTAKLADIPLQPEIPKINKNLKKKNGDFIFEENELNFTEVKEKFSVPKENQLSPLPIESGKGSDTKSGKSLDKENGPKSEPHLLQVIPPKENVEKSVEKEISNPAIVPKTFNVNKSQELLPALDTGFTQEIEIAGFKISLLIVYIIAGVGIPLIILIIVVVIIVIYRKKYPVRMRFGRKFSTFENPMYVSKDAHHPRELKRLTR